MKKKKKKKYRISKRWEVTDINKKRCMKNQVSYLLIPCELKEFSTTVIYQCHTELQLLVLNLLLLLLLKLSILFHHFQTEVVRSSELCLLMTFLIVVILLLKKSTF